MQLGALTEPRVSRLSGYARARANALERRSSNEFSPSLIGKDVEAPAVESRRTNLFPEFPAPGLLAYLSNDNRAAVSVGDIAQKKSVIRQCLNDCFG